MPDPWQRVRPLEGRTLYTTARRAPFDMVSVTDDGIQIRVQSSGKRYSVPRREIEEALALGLKDDELRTAKVRREGASEFHPSYVVAILKAISADHA
jgi:hypothetical protein